MLRPSEGRWWRAYEFMQAFPGTSYEQYLDTPREAIAWLTRIHAKVQRYQAEQREAALREARRG